MIYGKMDKRLIESMVQEYRECQENFKMLDKAHDVLFKEWESECEKGLCNEKLEELGKKLDEAYEKLETARSDRNIKAVACLDILLEKGII